MNAKRGYLPEDERNFSLEAIHTMQTASRHVRYLIGEGYDLKQASTFVGNHFLLSERHWKEKKSGSMASIPSSLWRLC